MSSAAGSPRKQEPELAMFSEETVIQTPHDLDRSRELSAHRIPPPGKIPGYVLGRCLGHGAYGSVWLATEEQTGKAVAVKFYPNRRGLDWSLLNREVEKLAVLYTSRNIVGLLSVGWDSDPPYFVMEYLQNGSLAQLLESGPLSVQDSLRIVQTILTALVHAHGSGILHCDLKPANVLLDADFEPRLADFGQSRLSHEHHPSLGTLFYMAPEQADLNAVPDARWDVFALGALWYETLTGTAPHRTPENERRILQAKTLGDRLEVYRDVLKQGGRPTLHRRTWGVDHRLAEIIDRCLEIDPQKRYPNAQAVLDAMAARERFRAHRPLLMLGIVAPTILLLGMIPLANRAMSLALGAARETLTARALESDAVAVKILARSMERELEDRSLEMTRVAADPQVREALLADANVPWEERRQLRAVLDQWRKQVDDERRARGRELDISWFLTDHTGLQLYRAPFSSDTVGNNYAWRDYFHGRHRNFAEDEVPADITPIDQPYLSLAFRSEATEQFMVAISVPVWNQDHTKVLGVLARTIQLGQLLSPYKPELAGISGGQVERILALVDGRDFEVLDHPWMKGPDGPHLPGEVFQQIRLNRRQRERMADLERLLDASRKAGSPPLLQGEDRDAHYRDPVGNVKPTEFGGDWLAAYWPVGTTGWLAVVQERRGVAMKPVEQMQAGLLRYARLGLVICCALIGSLWYFIFRAISNRRVRERSGDHRTRRGVGLRETGVTEASF